jgi:hypothetical protein
MVPPMISNNRGRDQVMDRDRTDPNIAVTIDTESFPTEVRTMRGCLTIMEVPSAALRSAA